ncbi:MAG TPA: amino acid adenylation domain-containing protein [Herpetosiphonaceae bacterium]
MKPSTSLSAEELELFAYLLEDEGVDTNRQRLIPRRDPHAEIPLSLAQERLWFLDQWEPGNPASNISFAAYLKGQLSIAVLQQSLDEIVRRHEVLRTTFRVVNDQPRQIVAPALDLPLSVLDLSLQQGDLQEHIIQHGRQRFDLQTGPLLRVDLLRLTDHQHLFLLTIHHIVFDGWSIGIFLRELTRLYAALIHDQPVPLPELPIQYADFAIWQREWLQGEILQQQLSYWQRQLAGHLPVLELPGDYPRPPILTYEGARSEQRLPLALQQQLHALSQTEGATLFMTLLAAFYVLLFRYTGETDLLVGSPIANRAFMDLEPLLGLFLNTLVLRADLSGNGSFRRLLHQVRDTTLEAYAHQNVPFEQLLETLRPPRDPSHTPLFQVLFMLQNAPGPDAEQRELEVEFARVEKTSARFDLTLSLSETADGLRVMAEYKTDLFAATTIDRLLGHYGTLLEAIAVDIDQPISRLPLLTPAEVQQLQAWSNATTFPIHQCLHHLVEAQAQQTPGAIAVVLGAESLTYHDLSRHSHQLAHHLRTLGAGPGQFVGVMMERSLDLLVGLLGVLKAGAAYLPLDPSYPPDRLNFIVADARPQVLLTDDAHAAQCQQLEWQGHLCTLTATLSNPALPDTPLHDGATPDNLAYVIYTSGSTGRPKGVAIPHRAAVNFLEAMRICPGLSAQDTLLAVTTIAFDIAVLELFLPLVVGARIALVSHDVASDGVQLAAALQASEATVMQATPATWRMLLDAGWAGNPALRILCGGEALPRDLASRLHERCAELWNMYGPTETTVWSTVLPVEIHEGPVPIGGPIANTQLYILDAQLQPVPIGVPGELYIGGTGVAQGYLNRPELTAEKFIANPFVNESAAGDRLYRTGDRVQWQPDGTISFLGRADFQVKLRGYRIEPGEIEALLLEQRTVAEAVVIVRPDAAGDQQLVAYVVEEPRTQNLEPNGEQRTNEQRTKEQTESQEPRTKNLEPNEEQRTKEQTETAPPPSPVATEPKAWRGSGKGDAGGEGLFTSEGLSSTLRKELAQRLPEYMIPTAFVLLDALPLTPNGKIDRKALPAPEQIAPTLTRSLVLPRTPVEAVLAILWSAVLGRETIGVEDNFFELGGHSLKATQILARVRATFHVNLTLRSVYQAPTIAALAELVVASEAQPGATEKIARTLLHIHSLSDETRQRLLEQKRKDRDVR